MAVAPHMGAETIRNHLLKYALEVPEGEAIVEVGSWLGAGTQYLAKPGKELHVYDRWQASREEVGKARKFGLSLYSGQDTLPIVQDRLRDAVNVHYHKGLLSKARYDGPTIGLYVDDASKKNWHMVSQIFSPYFRPGTVLVMMDYHFPSCTAIREAMEEHEMIEAKLDDTSTAVFLWHAQ